MKWLRLFLILGACSPAIDPAAMRAQLTPAQIGALRVPMLFVTAPRIDVAASLIPMRQRGEQRIWQTRDAVQIAARDGLVTATHGLGFDLIDADTAAVGNALDGGPAQYTRRMSYLSGDLQVEVLTFRCQMVSESALRHSPDVGEPVAVFREICKGRNDFENIYHRGADGTLWWSQQFVSVAIGSLQIETIKR